jgi:hypothetical protein
MPGSKAMNAIFRANKKALMEAINMTNAEYAREYMTEEEIDRSLEDLFREFGLLPKWEARAEAEGEAREPLIKSSRGDKILA